MCVFLFFMTASALKRSPRQTCSGVVIFFRVNNKLKQVHKKSNNFICFRIMRHLANKCFFLSSANCLLAHV